MATQYTKRDHDFVANVMRDAVHTYRDGSIAFVALAHVAARFASKFQIDNPTFDLDAFADACGFTKERKYG